MSTVPQALIRDVVAGAAIVPDLQADTPFSVYRIIARTMSRIRLLSAIGEHRILAAILQRERVASSLTAVGLATPHITLEELEVASEGCAVAWLSFSRAVPYGSTPSGRARVIVCVIGPSADYMSRVVYAASLAADASTVAELQQSKTSDAFRNVLAGAVGALTPPPPRNGSETSQDRHMRVRVSKDWHARPILRVVELSATFLSEIGALNVTRSEGWSNAKSAMEMILLEATKGCEIEFRACGPDANEALEAIRRLVDGGFLR